MWISKDPVLHQLSSPHLYISRVFSASITGLLCGRHTSQRKLPGCPCRICNEGRVQTFDTLLVALSLSQNGLSDKRGGNRVIVFCFPLRLKTARHIMDCFTMQYKRSMIFSALVIPSATLKLLRIRKNLRTCSTKG